MDTLNDISKFLWTALPIVLTPLIAAICIYLFQKEKVYRYPATGWMDVKTYPIPEDIRNFIATDGKEVDVIYAPSWGPHGKVLFQKYSNTYVKYWQPLPEAPNKNGGCQ